MPEFTLAPGEGVAGKVFATGEPAWIPDVRSSPDFLHYGGRRTDVRSFMCVPLVSKGKNIGVLMLNHPEPNAFEPELLPTMRVLASYLAIAIENAGMFGVVKSLAEKDSLTLLYNHGSFHEKLAIELERANRYVRPMAVIMLDLDHFKEINDRYGHPAGDAVLRKLASFLRERTRSTDAVVRYGGEEFAVLMATAESDVAFEQFDRIRAELEKTPFVVPGQADPIYVTISGGVATYPQDGQTFLDLIAVADAGLYHAKENGRNRIFASRNVELRPE